MKDPIHIADILGYHNNPTNDDDVKARLQEDHPAATKQRGTPKKYCSDVCSSACIIFLLFFCNFL